MAWTIAQAYEIELNSGLYGVGLDIERITTKDADHEIRMSRSVRSSISMGFMQKRTLLVSDHRNNQLNSRLNKKAE